MSRVIHSRIEYISIARFCQHFFSRFFGGFFTHYFDSLFTPQEDKPVHCCSFCDSPLYPGDDSWQLNGYVVCRACFPAFAERELAPYHSLCEEGD